MTEQELIEALAEKEHSSWSRWMQYLFSKCDDWYEVDTNGQEIYSGKIIPLELVERWQRQIDTPYAELSEQEKQSDRDEVARILPIIKEYKNTLDNTAVDSLFDQAKLAMIVARLADRVQRLETEVLSTEISVGKTEKTAKRRQTLLGRVNELSRMAALGDVDQSFFLE